MLVLCTVKYAPLSLQHNGRLPVNLSQYFIEMCVPRNSLKYIIWCCIKAYQFTNLRIYSLLQGWVVACKNASNSSFSFLRYLPFASKVLKLCESLREFRRATRCTNIPGENSDIFTFYIYIYLGETSRTMADSDIVLPTIHSSLLLGDCNFYGCKFHWCRLKKWKSYLVALDIVSKYCWYSNTANPSLVSSSALQWGIQNERLYWRPFKTVQVLHPKAISYHWEGALYHNSWDIWMVPSERCVLPPWYCALTDVALYYAPDHYGPTLGWQVSTHLHYNCEAAVLKWNPCVRCHQFVPGLFPCTSHYNADTLLW